MKKLGLIGYPLGHSFSKKFFTEKFEKEHISGFIYNNYPLETIEMFPELIQKDAGLIGLNVTIPYKQQVIPFLDELDEIALSIGAVNTIKITQQKNKPYLKGFNTDAIGFKNSLVPLLRPYHTHALVLGTGGASRAVVHVLSSLGIAWKYVSRTPKDDRQFAYADITQAVLKENLLIINTSPLGMHPNEDTCPDIPYNLLTSKHLLYDLVYNPEITLFMKKGEEQGATVKNGLDMLIGQAEAAWGIWAGE